MDIGYYTLEDIKNLTYDDIKHFNKIQMIELARQAQKYARERRNKVLSDLKEQGIPEPTIYRNFAEKKTPASQTKRLDFRIYTSKVKRLGRNYVLSLFFDAQRFLSSKTSTLEGWQDTMNKFESTIERHTGRKLDWGNIKNDKEKFSTFFNLYNKLKASDNDWKNLDSSQAFKEISDYITQHPNLSYENLYKNLLHKASKYYDKQQEEERRILRERGIKDSLDLDDNPFV